MAMNQLSRTKRERGRQREEVRERETERGSEREEERERGREREREMERGREREREMERGREREGDGQPVASSKLAQNSATKSNKLSVSPETLVH